MTYLDSKGINLKTKLSSAANKKFMKFVIQPLISAIAEKCIFIDFYITFLQ